MIRERLRKQERLCGISTFVCRCSAHHQQRRSLVHYYGLFRDAPTIHRLSVSQNLDEAPWTIGVLHRVTTTWAMALLQMTLKRCGGCSFCCRHRMRIILSEFSACSQKAANFSAASQPIERRIW